MCLGGVGKEERKHKGACEKATHKKIIIMNSCLPVISSIGRVWREQPCPGLAGTGPGPGRKQEAMLSL